MAQHTALLLIDVINDLEFEHGELLLENARSIVQPINHLRRQSHSNGVPVIYVNDNFGQWQSRMDEVVQRCLKKRGGSIVEALKPADDDYFIMKPKHSGFFSTPLSALLSMLEVDTLILTGMAGNICVLFTANDAYMRGYHLIIPSDCTASNVREDNDYALRLMEQTLKADISPSQQLDMKKVVQHSPRSNVIYSAE